MPNAPTAILVVFPPGSLAAKDRERLTKAGYCGVEAGDPSKVCMILPGSAIHTDDFSMAAIEALSPTECTNDRSRFARSLFDKIKKRREEQK